MKKLRYLIYLTLLLPTLAYTQPNGWIILNRTTNSTIVVDSINKYSVLNFNQTTSSVTLTIPNRTTLLTSGILTYLSNIGTTPVNISVTGSSTFSLPVNSMALLKWVGGKFAILYVGSGGGGGAFLPLAGGTADDSNSIKSISTVDRNLFSTTGSINLSYGNAGALRLYNSAGTQYTILSNSPTATRTVTIKDASGTLAFTSDIPTLTASNGLIRSTNDFQLGGLLSSNTTITGGSSRSLTLGSVGSKLTDFFSNTSNSIFLRANNASGVLELDAGLSGLYHSNGGAGLSSSLEGNDTRAYMNWDDGTHPTTISTDINGIGMNTVNGGFTGYFKTSRILTADRTIQLPDSSGTLALAESLSKYLPLSGGTMSGPINMFGFDIIGNQIKDPTGAITIIDVAGTIVNDQSGNISQDFTSRQLNNTAGNPMLDYSSSSSGIGIGNAGGSSFGFIRNTLVSGGSKQYELPPSSGTFALTSDITGLYLPLTLGANTTVAMGSRTLDFTKSGNIVYRPSNGTFYDATPVQSADMFNRLLYDNIGGPVFTWANASTAGIGITRVGNNTYVAYLKNSNLTADKTYQFPNANTTFVGDDATQTLTNKTISGASNTLTNIGNSSLSNSTISGISLGSNLSALTLGTYLTGTSYNGSAGVTVNVSTMTSTVGGAVPTPPNNTTTFLRGDGTFATPSSSGTVSTVSVTSTNGFAGTVANATTTPAITVSTTVTGLLKGNGTSMSAATAGTDYAVPATIAADATDADYTAVINSVKYLPSATLTANRSITIPTGSNGDFLEIYNNEAGFSWLLSGASVYLSDGSTIVTSLYANTNHLIRKVSGKWRILN